jgi:hypothetical protein
MLRLASTARLARRAFSTEVSSKIDWAELQSFVHSEEAKREISMLKKTLEDMKETLAAEAKARRPAARAAAQLPRVPDRAVLPQPGPALRSRCAGRAEHTPGCHGASGQAPQRPFGRALAPSCAPRVGTEAGLTRPFAAAGARAHRLGLLPQAHHGAGRCGHLRERAQGFAPAPAPFVWTHRSGRPRPLRPLPRPRLARAHDCPLCPRAGLKLPKYEGKEAEQLSVAFKELEKKAEAAAAKSAARMEEIKKEIAAIAAEREKLKTLTIDEILAADPKLLEKLNQDIRDDKWY